MFWLLISFFCLAAHVFAASNYCTQFPYDVLLPLSSYPAAESFCSTRYPVAPCTTTVSNTLIDTSTSTVYTTVETDTTTTGITTHTTVISTETDLTTTTVDTVYTTTTTNTEFTTTSTATLTNYSTTATMTVYASTVTVTTNVPTVWPRNVVAQSTSSIKTSSANAKTTLTTSTKPTPTSTTKLTTTTPSPISTATGVANLLSSLQAQAASFVSSACYCIESHPACATVTTGSEATTITTTTIPVSTTVSDEGTTIFTSTATITNPTYGLTTIPTDTTTTIATDTTTTITTDTTTTISTATTITSTSTTVNCVAPCPSSSANGFTQIAQTCGEYDGGFPGGISTNLGSSLTDCQALQQCISVSANARNKAFRLWWHVNHWNCDQSANTYPASNIAEVPAAGAAGNQYIWSQ